MEEETAAPPPVDADREDGAFAHSGGPEDDPSRQPPPPAASPPQPTSRDLRRFVARHNGQALLLAFFSLVGSVVLWGLIYVVTYWFTLVAATVEMGLDPKRLPDITRRNIVGSDFLPHFLFGAGSALALGWLCRRYFRLETLRDRRHYFLWVAAELFMVMPNLTFSIWGNLSAVCRLRRRDAEPAWSLLQRILDEGGRLSMTSLPLEIQDEKALDRILWVLQIVGLVGVREKTEGWFLYLHQQDGLVLRAA